MFIYNHNKGRLGNSLFRLFSNIVFINIHSYISPLYMLDDINVINNTGYYFNFLAVTDEYFINWMNKLLQGEPLEQIDTNTIIYFDGYYQHDKIFVKYKAGIINFIEKNPNLIIKTDRNDSYKVIDFINFKIKQKYNIVVHLRLEDFVTISQVIDPNYITIVIDKINKEYNNETICFVVNKPTTKIEVKYISFFTEKYSNIVVESNDVITDYTIMREAKVLVCSCSTLSWAAAILSNSIQKVYMPDYKNIHGSHQTCKQPILNTELYEIETCTVDELDKICGSIIMNWSSVKGLGGRFCNKVIINTCFSILAEKNNLYIDYDYTNQCNELGIHLFCGTNKYNNSILINDNNLIFWIDLSEKQPIKSNILCDGCYFQTKEISNYLFKYFNLPIVSNNIINKNKFNERYNNNNDIFIHIRLGDVTRFNPGYNYYVKAIETIKEYNNIYISSDSISHEICQKLIINYKATPVNYNEVDTIHFGSTCKNVILSHGSFSTVIGYLSFFSNVYYAEYETNKIWYGDMFSIPVWNKVNL